MKFFKYGIDIFDARKKEYGGFNHFIAGKIFRWRLCYLFVSVEKRWSFNFIHNDEDYYYDGFHNRIDIGFIEISYGT